MRVFADCKSGFGVIRQHGGVVIADLVAVTVHRLSPTIRQMRGFAVKFARCIVLRRVLQQRIKAKLASFLRQKLLILHQKPLPLAALERSFRYLFLFRGRFRLSHAATFCA